MRSNSSWRQRRRELLYLLPTSVIGQKHSTPSNLNKSLITSKRNTTQEKEPTAAKNRRDQHELKPSSNLSVICSIMKQQRLGLLLCPYLLFARIVPVNVLDRSSHTHYKKTIVTPATSSTDVVCKNRMFTPHSCLPPTVYLHSYLVGLHRPPQVLHPFVSLG